jgi:FkbM family methyltransferase
MQKIRTFFRKIIFLMINNLIKFKIFMKLLNFIFERVPHKFVVYLTRHLNIPNKNYLWSIKLNNKKKVTTKIYKDNPKTWQFALSYKWHDRALNILENILVNYYPKNTLWIDCGANLGLRSLTALSENLQVYMIEPNEETNKLNQERCEMNNFTNYHILQFGLSNTNTVKTLYIDRSSYLSTIIPDSLSDENITDKKTIDVKKLDDVFQPHIASKCNMFIKIDVEGHEDAVLDGAKSLISSLAPTFLIEINSRGTHINNVFKLMRGNGYQVYQTLHGFTDLKFLEKCPSDISSFTFRSNDFLFVKDKSIAKLLNQFIVK